MILAVALVTLCPLPAAAVRVVTYNILNFPGTTGSAREDDFRVVVEQLDADVLVVQEMLSSAGVSQFLNNVLNYGGTGEYAAAPFVDGPDTDNTLFYRVTTIDLVSSQEISTALRNISEYTVRPVGYSSSDAEFRVYSLHLKASSTSEDLAKRLAEATILRNHMNSFPAGECFMVAGDYNIRASTEAAYQKLVASEANDNGRVKDPLDEPGTWHDNYSFAWIHTQSPRTTAFGGGATGGMDDRFDLILTSYALEDGEGMDYIGGSYVSYGNDGYHFNTAINIGTNYAVGATIANALHEAADHLPVYADFQVPALIDAPIAMNIGEAIVGSYVALPLTVENVATAPADELDYVLAAPGGFSAPSGPHQLEAGTETDHDVSMDTSLPGARSGTLTIASDDVDNPSWGVSMSGAVLDHAWPSLDSLVVALAGTLDFGAHGEGEFPPLDLSVFNFDYSVLQALLDVYSAEITGAESRFGFLGGFALQQAGTSPAEFTLEFDDAGAAQDSLYSAVLTLRTRDDATVHGWAHLDSLVVHLSAFVQNGLSVPENEVTHFALAFGSANPFRDEAVLVLTMPDNGRALVQVYDVTGRRVRTLIAGELQAGSHRVEWDGRDDSGRPCASGVYLSRASCERDVDSRKLVLLR
ncbi:MAG: FlgD immunoglobulin-like domain containing protein [Candidatus Eisenbacteria bacterium]